MLLAREGNHRHLPTFLEANSPRGLQRKIDELQRKTKSEYRFISIYFDSKKEKHVAWYYYEKTQTQEIKELVDELTTK